MIQVAKLFPNMGHRYWFLPFEEEFPPGNVPEWAQPRCSPVGTEVDPWRVYVHFSRVEGGWTAAERPWIRWRLNRKRSGPGEKISGVEVCIDTNMGGVDRGVPVGPVSKKTFIVEGSKRQQSQYVYEAEELVPEPNNAEAFAFILYEDNDIKQPPDGLLADERPPGESQGFSPAHLPIGTAEDAPKGWKRINELHVYWPARTARRDVDVELIVDFGNSRSAAVLFAHLKDGGEELPLNQVIQPVLMRQASREPTDSEQWRQDPDSIFESWILLREPQFSYLWDLADHGQNTAHWSRVEEVKPGLFKWPFGGTPPKRFKVTETTFRIPQMFMEVSPTLLGDQARETYQSVRFEQGDTLYLGSPKRYVCDTEAIRDDEQEWSMMPAVRTEAILQNANLHGLACGFLYVNVPWKDDVHEEWNIATPPHKEEEGHRRPAFNLGNGDARWGRAEMMVLAALNVVETAYRQLGVFNIDPRFGLLRYRLSRVSVTYPPGWTILEKRIYKRKWRTALNIFGWTHLTDPVNEYIELGLDCDEAVAAQLPIIYGEILALGNSANRWLRLMGRPVADQANPGSHHVRVMTIDIGGGTTDYATVEYRNRTTSLNGADLEATLLFKDSSTVAGDTFLKRIIEDVLLPAIGAAICKNDPTKREKYDKTKQEKFRQFFNTAKGGAEAEEWKRVVRLVLVELATYHLKVWAAGDDTVDNIVPPQLHKESLRTLVQKFVDLGILTGEQAIAAGEQAVANLPVDFVRLEAAAHEEFSGLFDLFGVLGGVFEVDLVVLSGKPSELPGIRSLLQEYYPLSANRIVPAKGYGVGDWYPFATNGKIRDAKTVTVTGAALFRAINSGYVDGWGLLRTTAHREMLSTSRWQQIAEGRASADEPAYFEGIGESGVGKNRTTVQMRIGTAIGRSLFKHQRHPEPAYLLKWKREYEHEARRWGGNLMLKVTLARQRATDLDSQEGLLLEAAEVVKEEIQYLPQELAEHAGNMLELVELKVWTLPQNQRHWMDVGTFTVNWAAYTAAASS